MMITLKCNDGTIQIGGNFEVAKSLVKSRGARFNWNTKEWEINAPMKEFDSLTIRMPVDVLSGTSSNRMRSGDHMTRYGNVYRRNEWEARKEIEKVCIHFQDRHDALDKELRRRLLEITPAADKIIGMVMDFDFEQYIIRGSIKFSTPEKENAIRRLNDWYTNEKSKIYSEESDAEEAAKDAILDKYNC